MCGYFIIDRTTGERQPYPLQEVVSSAASEFGQFNEDVRVIIQNGGYWQNQPTVAGNIAVFAVSVTDGDAMFSEGLVIIDVAQQTVVGALPFTYGPVALSDDGSWVFVNGNGTGLTAFDVATGNSYRFGLTMNDGFNSIVVRNRFQT